MGEGGLKIVMNKTLSIEFCRAFLKHDDEIINSNT